MAYAVICGYLGSYHLANVYYSLSAVKRDWDMLGKVLELSHFSDFPILVNDVGGYTHFDENGENVVKVIKQGNPPSIKFSDRWRVDHPRFECGWISPEGTTYACPMYDHVYLAEDLLKEKFQDCKIRGFESEEHLLKLGWMKISGNLDATYYHRKLTNAQARICNRISANMMFG